MTAVAAVPPATVGDLRRRVAGRLAAAFATDGRDGTPDLDARAIVGHAIGCRANEVVLHDTAAIEQRVEEAVFAMAAARIAGVPVARLVGEKEFWSLPFRLSADTLVPRPDTETLVEAALAAIDAAGRSEDALTLLDFGTGSGAILLALLAELPAATGIGVDIAEGATVTARDNALRLGLDARAAFIVGDWASAIAGRFDLVVANPPYVRSSEIDALPVEIRVHDPYLSLDGGEDGLAAYGPMLDSFKELLAPNGAAFVEVGLGQADSIVAVSRQNGYTTSIHCDLAGIERVIQLQPATSNFDLEIDREPDTVRSP